MWTLSIGLLSLVRVSSELRSRSETSAFARQADEVLASRRAQQRTSENRPEQIRLTPNSAVPPPLIPEAAHLFMIAHSPDEHPLAVDTGSAAS
jgi:hypothetical protein